ncbi:MAG: hypothetical protein ACHQ6U_05255, partial [Thermodesulfobacteriota bacterium]
DKITIEDEKKRVSKYFREGIFRRRIFELYDNLIDIKPIDEIVEDGAYRACKDMVVNRVMELEGKTEPVDPVKIARQARKSFPYSNLPRDAEKARNVFTKILCDLVSNLVINDATGKTRK